LKPPRAGVLGIGVVLNERKNVDAFSTGMAGGCH
jgi:hypothetical protein